MAVTSEALKQDLDRLTQGQLQQVADFIAFLKFRDRPRLELTPSQLATLAKEFADFAEEDRALAELGMRDYGVQLDQS